MYARSQEVTLAATDAPRTPLRYVSLRFDNDMPDDDLFGLRLPPHPAAPASTENLMPPTDKESIAEIINLLKRAEKRSEEAVTQGDLTALANTVMGGIREVETKLTSRLETVEGTVRVHALALKAMDDRTGGTGAINLRTSSAPRRMSPMPQTISVEETAGGGIKITDGSQFTGLIKRLDEQEKTLALYGEREAAAEERERIAEEGQRIAQIRQGAVQEYADKLEEKSKRNVRLFRRILFGAAVPVIIALAHLVQAYIAEKPTEKPATHVTSEH